MSIEDSHTVTLTGLEISSILSAIDHQRDTRPDLLPFALKQLAHAETTLLVALIGGADEGCDECSGTRSPSQHDEHCSLHGTGA